MSVLRDNRRLNGTDRRSTVSPTRCRNSEVARYFEDLADLLEIDGANPFRIRAYRNAARTIEDLWPNQSHPWPVREKSALTANSPESATIWRKKSSSSSNRAGCPNSTSCSEKVPPGVVDMLRIPGSRPQEGRRHLPGIEDRNIGPTAGTAAESGEIAALKGFGKKTAQSILEGLDQVETSGQTLSARRRDDGSRRNRPPTSDTDSLCRPGHRRRKLPATPRNLRRPGPVLVTATDSTADHGRTRRTPARNRCPGPRRNQAACAV